MTDWWTRLLVASGRGGPRSKSGVAYRSISPLIRARESVTKPYVCGCIRSGKTMDSCGNTYPGGSKKRRRRQGRRVHSDWLKWRVSINDRSGSTKDRATFGPLESDRIIGARHSSAIRAAVERQSRFVMAKKLDHPAAATAQHPEHDNNFILAVSDSVALGLLQCRAFHRTSGRGVIRLCAENVIGPAS